MWRRVVAAWAVAACGCSFEALDIRLRDAATDVASSPDVPVVDAAPDAGPDASPPDAPAPAGQLSCSPPVAGCGQARITGGTFAMGDPMAYDLRGVGNRAVPVQPSITVSTFMLDRYEVTVARFRRFVRARALSAGVDFDERTGSNHCNWTASERTPVDREGHPMNCLTWQTAQDFCGWDTPGGTLPAEAQWEYAARGSMNRPWPWGGPDSATPDARVCFSRYSPPPLGTCLEEDPVYTMGATPASEGVWHLVGNVWEWTRDWYAPYLDTTCWNGRARTDPTCVNSAIGFRSIRGGSWGYGDASYVRSGGRSSYRPTSRVDDVGFRCAGTPR